MRQMGPAMARLLVGTLGPAMPCQRYAIAQPARGALPGHWTHLPMYVLLYVALVVQHLHQRRHQPRLACNSSCPCLYPRHPMSRFLQPAANVRP